MNPTSHKAGDRVIHWLIMRKRLKNHNLGSSSPLTYFSWVMLSGIQCPYTRRLVENLTAVHLSNSRNAYTIGIDIHHSLINDVTISYPVCSSGSGAHARAANRNPLIRAPQPPQSLPSAWDSDVWKRRPCNVGAGLHNRKVENRFFCKRVSAEKCNTNFSNFEHARISAQITNPIGNDECLVKIAPAAPAAHH